MTFKGKVVPVRPPSEIGNLPPVVWENIDTGEVESYAVSFSGADVSVSLTITVPLDEERISQYRNRALDIARSALDIVCFQTGWGLLLYLDVYTSPYGVEDKLIPGDPNLARLVSSLNNVNFPIMFQLMAGDTTLQRVLNDLITGITWPHAPAINCARAIEGIRKHNNPSEGKNDRGSSWGLLQEALNISRAYREFVIEVSTSPRHGDSSFIKPEIQEDAIVRAWTIMDRYFHYLGRGKKPLGELGFPLL